MDKVVASVAGGRQPEVVAAQSLAVTAVTAANMGHLVVVVQLLAATFATAAYMDPTVALALALALATIHTTYLAMEHYTNQYYTEPSLGQTVVLTMLVMAVNLSSYYILFQKLIIIDF